LTRGGQDKSEAAKDPLLRLIEDVNAKGLRINNLFQLGEGWRANLWDGQQFYEFGDGVTALEALSAALARAGRVSSGSGAPPAPARGAKTP
jgi:hypothetical protein